MLAIDYFMAKKLLAGCKIIEKSDKNKLLPT